LKCDDVIIKIGQATYVMGLARRKIRDMVLALYGRERARILFGRSIGVPEVVAQLQRDLQEGALEVKDTKVCLDNRCVDLVKLMDALNQYYEAYGERLRALRELEWCEVD